MAALAELLGEALAAPDGSAVATASVPARGVSLVGLYFGYCGGGPCAQVAANLAAFYGRFQPGPEGGDAAGAAGGAAAAPSQQQQLEIVFVSAEQEQPRWQEATRAMPWLALPFADKRRKLKLWNKFRVSNIPSLIFIDANTGKVVCRNGLLVIRDDPEGLEFPWGPRPFSEVVAGPLLRNSGPPLESSVLEGSHVGVYFSAHWCPPCRSLTRVLVESYRKIKDAGQKFEIVFVSADRSYKSGCGVNNRRTELFLKENEHLRNQESHLPFRLRHHASGPRAACCGCGIPTLIVLDTKGDVITRQGRVEVLNDIECQEFPWHPKPVLELTDSNAVQLNEGPCLVLFVDSDDDGESEAAKQLIQPIAEKIIAQYKAKDEETPLLFFVAGEDDMTDSLRDYTNLPEAAPLLTILDMSARAKYVMDVEEITPPIVETFVNDFLADKLKPEPI
ncbi:LOW QUALITY PROTEIN: nucleoredoxin [Pantherophis guttatus]|uniref:LOW QUALITY PROTEIN: nucleoredoxin n=1 Tax=Pantherophis guttatus TaxID=94885 RepID=A0ABM3YZQ5_PANGU|nr:LOW QUALITY PROTEIN: nucleoredoxin [Pantherophis guttatus]